jgi:cell division protease FtsH
MADKQQKQKLPWIGMLIYMTLGALIFYVSFGSGSGVTEQVSYSDFLSAIQDGKVEAVRVTGTELIGVLKGTDKATSPGSITTPRVPTMDESWLMQELRNRKVQIIAQPQIVNWWSTLLVWVVPIMLLVFLYSLAARARMGQSGFTGVGKSRAKIYDQYTKSNVTFADVAGVEEAEAELIEVVDFLKNPQRYTRLGGRIPKGVLLVGPPG